MKNLSALRYILIALIVLILGTLAGWYFFIRTKQAEIESADLARGAGLAPSFASRVGSTYENIIGSLASSLTGERTSEEEEREVPQLSQVNKTPTAGARFIGNAASTTLRFVERGTGYVFDVDLETLELKRLTATLVPRTYEALVGPDDRIIMEGLDESGAPAVISARIATGTPGDVPAALVQTLLPYGMRGVTGDIEGKKIFYFAESPEGGIGISATWDGKDPEQVFSSAIAGWQARFLPGERIVLVQKPSDSIPGYAYELKKDGTLSPIVQNVPGLTVLSHSTSSALLYGTSAGGLSLFARTGNSASAVRLPIRTIADKCVWAPGKQLIAYCAVPQVQPPANFLDRWHRGEIHTADAWWRVDASAGSAELLLSPGNVSLDVERPTIDANGNYIAFMNAADKSLWLLRISSE